MVVKESTPKPIIGKVTFPILPAPAPAPPPLTPAPIRPRPPAFEAVSGLAAEAYTAVQVKLFPSASCAVPLKVLPVLKPVNLILLRERFSGAKENFTTLPS